MDKNTSNYRLKVYISSTDKVDHDLLGEHLVREAHKSGLAGATLMKGIMGYGASSVIHSVKFWEVSEKVPLILEIVDQQDKIMEFIEQIKPGLESMRYGCLLTLEKVDVLIYKSGNGKLPA